VGRPCSCVVYSCSFFLHCHRGWVCRDFTRYSALLVQVDLRFRGRTAYVRYGTRAPPAPRVRQSGHAFASDPPGCLASTSNDLNSTTLLRGTSFPNPSSVSASFSAFSALPWSPCNCRLKPPHRHHWSRICPNYDLHTKIIRLNINTPLHTTRKELFG
jgi:hypothetical protein